MLAALYCDPVGPFVEEHIRLITKCCVLSCSYCASAGKDVVTCVKVSFQDLPLSRHAPHLYTQGTWHESLQENDH